MKLQSTAMAGQDIWAWEVCGRKTDGSCLDIGSYNLIWCNNSYGLEQLGWECLMVDLFKDEENLPKRKGRFIQGDATKLDWARILGVPGQWDYLSLDVDDASVVTLKALPLDRVRFNCITIETDAYRLGNGPRDEMRRILDSWGYELICADVNIAYPEGQLSAYEDWVIHPEAKLDFDKVNKSKSEGALWSEIIQKIQ